MGVQEDLARPAPPVIRVLLIEDHTLVRAGLRLLLEREPDLAVVGDAPDGERGLRLFERLGAAGGVDVVVTDLGLPGIGGLEVLRRLKARRPAARVLLLTVDADDAHLRGMLALGADGYLLKQAGGHELAQAIRTVARGEAALAPAVARRLLTQVRRDQERGQRLEALTERERQVLCLLAAGTTSKEIAQRLGLSLKTVDNHRTHILRKLGVTNTAAAVALGYQQRLITEPPAAPGLG